MFGMIAAVVLLASLEDQIALTPPALGGHEQHLDGVTLSGPVAGMGALGLVGGDVVAFMAGAALIGLTSGDCEAGGLACVNGGAVALALIGIATIPPTLALLLGREQARTPLDSRAVLLTIAAQGAAIGLVVGAATASSGGMRAACLVSAGALHFVGIPLAVGMVPSRAAQGAGGEHATPTLSLALSW